MISLRNVSKYYGKFLALDGLNFDVGAGDIVALLGPNGAGKTTTMRILTGFMPPTHGEVTIDGMDVFEESDAVRSIIGYLPEVPPVYPELTVAEYLTFIAEIKKVRKEKIREQVENAIEMADLKNRRNTMIGFLSKGLKQRVGIAQSIVNDPKVLVLDEPTVGLDPVQVVEMRAFIKGLARKEKRTVILSTHLLAEAQEICEKAVIINNGRIIAVDTIDNLRKKHPGEMKITVQVEGTTGGLAGKLKSLSGVLEVETNENTVTVTSTGDIRSEIARTTVESGAGLLEMTRGGDTLEDIFIKLVK
jgi:ABC-2 type transport system ATP-binding protein